MRNIDRRQIGYHHGVHSERDVWQNLRVRRRVPTGREKRPSKQAQVQGRKRDMWVNS